MTQGTAGRNCGSRMGGTQPALRVGDHLSTGRRRTVGGSSLRYRECETSILRRPFATSATTKLMRMRAGPAPGFHEKKNGKLRPRKILPTEPCSKTATFIHKLPTATACSRFSATFGSGHPAHTSRIRDLNLPPV